MSCCNLFIYFTVFTDFTVFSLGYNVFTVLIVYLRFLINFTLVEILTVSYKTFTVSYKLLLLFTVSNNYLRFLIKIYGFL